MTMRMKKPTTIKDYIKANWVYFGREWRAVVPCVQFYEKNPDDLVTEKVGVDAFNDKQNLQQRDSSSLRTQANPPHKAIGEIIKNIRHLHAEGVDVEDIRLAIGPVSFDGQVPDYLAISSITYICRTGPHITKKLTIKEV